jgi:hypothetical protein
MSASQALYGQASDGQSATNSGERSRGESSKKAKDGKTKRAVPWSPSTRALLSAPSLAADKRQITIGTAPGRHIALIVSPEKLSEESPKEARARTRGQARNDAVRTIMQTNLTPAPQLSSQGRSVMAERFAPERLQLLRGLELSLSGSRQALLALDLAGIEQGTREQVGLVRELQKFPEREMRMRRLRPGFEPEQTSERREGGTEETGAEVPPWSGEMAEDVRRCEEAVLQAARVQAALLARARRKLRILANMLAGPSLNYSCLFAKPDGPTPSVYGMREGEI